MLGRAYDAVFVPGGVEQETRAYFDKEGGARVPDLGAHPWLVIDAVSEDDLAAAGSTLKGPYRDTTRHLFMGRTLDRPDLEVVLSAERHGAVAALEDKKAMACARDRGVALTGTAQLLCALEDRGLLDAAACAKVVLATGYYTLDLQVLSNGHRLTTWLIH
jgi:predicted nucleic acid-binding protein